LFLTCIWLTCLCEQVVVKEIFVEILCATTLHVYGARGGVMVKATNPKFAGSIPDCVIGIFQWHNHSGRTMALESTQSLKEMSTRCISWG
jgi:hypothetical protein